MAVNAGLLQILARRQAETAAVAGVLSSVDIISAAKNRQIPEDYQTQSEREAQRILKLPTWNLDEWTLDLTEKYKTIQGEMRLSPVQSAAIYWAGKMNGALLPLAVGAGKTLVSLLINGELGGQRPVLLIPPTMQIPIRREIEKLKKHFNLPIKNLMILPYSQLSVAKNTDIFERIKPDVIIADEAHLLRDPNSARTRRVLRYAKAFPGTKFVFMSGTLTSKSLKDYAHLAELALREGSPVPRTQEELIAWANVIDAKGVPQSKDWQVFADFEDIRGDLGRTKPRTTSPFEALDTSLDTQVAKERAREVFQRRLTTTPGVVATKEGSVQCSLFFHERTVDVAPSVNEALADLNMTWRRPDGEELVSALEVWRVGMQLSQGFYLRWVWPEGQIDFDWLGARAEWHRAIREVLKWNVVGMDSPLLVTRAVMTGRLTDRFAVSAWRAWDEHRHKPKPPTEIIWFDDSLVENALEWAQEHPKGLIWYNDHALELALRALDIRTFGAGEVPPDDGRGMALSIRAHGTGLNLQKHNENLCLSFPSSGKTAEQLIGRTHRQGQEADDVSFWYYNHTKPYQDALKQARNDAQYIQQTLGSPQKLVYGTFT